MKISAISVIVFFYIYYSILFYLNRISFKLK
jgi:hypothetical protein